jgi:hypothetical protein
MEQVLLTLFKSRNEVLTVVERLVLNGFRADQLGLLMVDATRRAFCEGDAAEESGSPSADVVSNSTVQDLLAGLTEMKTLAGVEAAVLASGPLGGAVSGTRAPQLEDSLKALGVPESQAESFAREVEQEEGILVGIAPSDAYSTRTARAIVATEGGATPAQVRTG